VFFVITILACPRAEVVVGGGESSQCDRLIFIIFWCTPDKILYAKDIVCDEGAEVRQKTWVTSKTDAWWVNRVG
jgi:hypothetical protein